MLQWSMARMQNQVLKKPSLHNNCSHTSYMKNVKEKSHKRLFWSSVPISKTVVDKTTQHRSIIPLRRTGIPRREKWSSQTESILSSSVSRWSGHLLCIVCELAAFRDACTQSRNLPGLNAQLCWTTARLCAEIRRSTSASSKTRMYRYAPCRQFSDLMMAAPVYISWVSLCVSYA